MKIIPLKDFKIVQPPFQLDLKQDEEVELPEIYIQNMITEGVISDNNSSSENNNSTIEG